MKVEIELNDLEALKLEALNKQSEIVQLKIKLNELDEHTLKQKAVDLSLRLLNDYLQCVFLSLGFDQKDEKNNDTIFRGSIKYKMPIYHMLDFPWSNEFDRLNIQLGADITRQFRNAYLEIGVTPEKNTRRTSSIEALEL